MRKFNKPIFKTFVEDNQSLLQQSSQISNSSLQTISYNQCPSNRNNMQSNNVNIKSATKAHIPKYLCSECNKNYKSRVNYDKHMRSHYRPR